MQSTLDCTVLQMEFLILCCRALASVPGSPGTRAGRATPGSRAPRRLRRRRRRQDDQAVLAEAAEEGGGVGRRHQGQQQEGVGGAAADSEGH